MPEMLTVLLGLAVTLVISVDAVLTTLTVSTAAGPLTGRMLPSMWSVLLGVAGHGRLRRSVLPLSGAVLLLSTVLLWVVGLWAGWWLVFVGSESVEQASSGRAAGIWDVGYFSGMTVVTLGTGDFVADATGWRFVSAVASLSGLFLVTLAITYLVSVLSAVVDKRALAIHIHGLGRSADDIVLRAWTGSRYSSMFEQQLISLTPLVATTAEQHLAYPVLHYFHATKPSLSAPVALASLNDALLVAGDLTAEQPRADPSAVHALNHAVSQYLEAAGDVASLPPQPAPPPPPLCRLEQHGIRLLDAAHVARALDQASSRRADLNRLVVSDGGRGRRDGSPSRPRPRDVTRARRCRRGAPGSAAPC